MAAWRYDIYLLVYKCRISSRPCISTGCQVKRMDRQMPRGRLMNNDERITSSSKTVAILDPPSWISVDCLQNLRKAPKLTKK